MTRYYVAVGAERTGPYSPDELNTAVTLRPGSLVWAQGMAEWTRAEQVPELASLLAAAPAEASEGPARPPSSLDAEPPAPQPPPPETGGTDGDFILLNPRLPRMARATCVFTLVVNPALWLLSKLSCLSFRRWDAHSTSAGAALMLEVAYALLGLVTVGILFYGGLQLRARRRRGVTVLKVGFWADVALFAAGLIVLAGVFVHAAVTAPAPDGPALTSDAGAPAAAAAAADVAPQSSSSEPPPNAGDVVRWVFDAAGTLAFGGEVVLLVWLTRQAERLPLVQ